jgi:mannose-1-phosphate guanylyltransferase
MSGFLRILAAENGQTNLRMDNNSNLFCVILAGGKGKRLWPSSRVETPKQFMDFFGTGRTQLQATYDRFAKILPKEHIYICTCKEYEQKAQEQLPDLPTSNILVEPVNRNTAPSVAWAGRRIRREHGTNANIIITPSDQLVLNEELFHKNVLEGLEFVANHDILLTMGVIPTRPEPGYGYIQLGEQTELEDVYKVQSFTEKPEREFAKLFMESGEFYWNTGIYMANVRYLREAFLALFPELSHRLDDIRDDQSLEEELAFVNQYYPSYPNISLDYAILERSKNVHVMKCDFGWADLGTWHGIYECLQKGREDNVVIDSEVVLEECSNNIIKLPKGKLGVINGLNGFIVAEQDNVLMICKKGDSSSMVKKYANEVGIRYGEDYI